MIPCNSPLQFRTVGQPTLPGKRYWTLLPDSGRLIYLLPNTFSYPSTLTLSLIRSGHSVTFVPIVARKREGKSKIKLLKDGIRFFMIMLKIATLFSPFRVFLPVSMCFFGVGMAYYVYTFIT